MEEINEQLVDMKVAKDFQETIKNSKKLFKFHTDNIPTSEQLDDQNKGQWVEHSLEHFKEVFNGLLDYCNDEEEFDDGSLDWNTVNFVPYGADYYREKFSGFPDEVYKILEESTDPQSRIVDERVPPFKYDDKETTISFS